MSQLRFIGYLLQQMSDDFHLMFRILECKMDFVSRRVGVDVYFVVLEQYFSTGVPPVQSRGSARSCPKAVIDRSFLFTYAVM